MTRVWYPIRSLIIRGIYKCENNYSLYGLKELSCSLILTYPPLIFTFLAKLNRLFFSENTMLFCIALCTGVIFSATRGLSKPLTDLLYGVQLPRGKILPHWALWHYEGVWVILLCVLWGCVCHLKVCQMKEWLRQCSHAIACLNVNFKTTQETLFSCILAVNEREKQVFNRAISWWHYCWKYFFWYCILTVVPLL